MVVRRKQLSCHIAVTGTCWQSCSCPVASVGYSQWHPPAGAHPVVKIRCKLSHAPTTSIEAE